MELEFQPCRLWQDIQPVHIFRADGSQQVCLSVVDNNGNEANICEQITITPSPPTQKPFVDFTYSPMNPIVSETVKFTDRSWDPNAPIIAWHWEFGDGSTSDSQTPSHVFGNAGDIRTCLTIIDRERVSARRCMPIVLSPIPPNPEPVVDFIYIYKPNATDNSSPVEFIDRSFDPNGSIISWHWDFGDGNVSGTPNPIYEFHTADYMNVCLTVIDNKGASATKCKWMPTHVNPRSPRPLLPPPPPLFDNPHADFTYSPIDPMVNTPVHFKYDSSYGNKSITNWYWDFGDGISSIEPNPNHSFSYPGDKKVCLTVTNSRIATSECKRIFVSTKPLVEPPMLPSKPQVHVTYVVRLSGQFHYVGGDLVDISDLEIYSLDQGQSSVPYTDPYDDTIRGFRVPPSDILFAFRNRKTARAVVLNPNTVSIVGSADWRKTATGAWGLQVAR